jgi:hypothetical protein
MVRRAATTPLRRAGTPAEIAAVVAFLLSEESAYLTGEVVSVDGGAAIMSTVRSSGGAGAWDFAALDQRTYRRPAGSGQQESPAGSGQQEGPAGLGQQESRE